MDINLFKESQYSSIAKGIDYLSGFIGLIIFAHIIGAEGLGLYYIFLAIASIMSKPVSGFGVAIESYLSSTESKEYISIGLIFTMLYISFILSLFILSYIFLFSTIFTIYVEQILLTCILVIGLSFSTISRRIYSGLGYPSNSVFVSTMEGILETLLQILFIILLVESEISLLLGTFISSIIGSIYILTKPMITLKKPSKNSIYNILYYSKWSIPTRIFKQLYKDIDALLIGIIISPTATGIYEATLRLLKPSKIISYGIEKPLLVKISQLKTNTQKRIIILNTFGSYTSILSIPILMGAILLNEELLYYLFGSEFTDGKYILIAAGIYYILYSQSNILNSYIHGIQKPRIASISMFISFMIRLSLIIISLQLFGLNGIIIAIIISESIRFFILYVGLYNESNEIYKPVYIKYQIYSSIIMFISLYIFLYYIKFTFLIMIITIFLGGIIYFISLYLFDRQYAAKINKMKQKLLNI